GRKIGDEYRYILDRKYAKKYPGNMLKRPGLLLNPWAIRKTEAGQEQLSKDQAYRGGAASRSGEAKSEGSGGGRAGGGDNYANLDFLAAPSLVVANLKPDKNGVVKIDRAALGPHAHVRILAVDPQNAVSQELSLKDQPLKTDELRLALGLDPEKPYAEKKIVSVVNADQAFTIADITTSKMESYGSLSKVFGLYATLTGNATLNEFDFILDWPNLTPDEKQETYSKYACHELHFFIYHKDPEFFKTVIGPYLKNKKDKTFMDHWLLDDDLVDYLKPWAFQRLNIVERILLGRRIERRRPSLARHVKELADLIPPNIEDFNYRFDTAIQSSALETGEGFTALAARAEVDKLKSMDRDGDGLARFDAPARPAMTAPSAVPRPMAKMAKKMPGAVRAIDRGGEVEEELMEMAESMDVLAEAPPVANKAFFKARRESRSRGRANFRKLDKTEELVENNYYRLPIEQQLSRLVEVNGFWNDYAAHEAGKPFLSVHIAQANRNFAEMMMALAVTDLPFEAGEQTIKAEGVVFQMTSATPLVAFHQEIREGELSKDKTPILVSQNFFRADDRYRYENNERFEKYIREEFLRHVVYGCQVILTNPNANRQKLSLLLQLPRGAMPVNNGFYTRGRQVTLEAYATTTMEYYFYFPSEGRYPHYPVHVARNEQLVASAEPLVFNVVEKLSRIDKTSWAWISQNGSEEDVLNFLAENNLNRLKLDEIAWRMQDKGFFGKAIDLLSKRYHYAHTLWSYGVQHNDLKTAREYLRHSPYADRVGEYIDTALLTVDPVARHRYQHMEYEPLVNPRAHQVV
ncbi:MAG: hypothetical protein AAF492_09225, partial [Verrucomicrobiota bacterium]